MNQMTKMYTINKTQRECRKQETEQKLDEEEKESYEHA